MKTDIHKWFPELKPPAGGAQRLRAQLDTEPQRTLALRPVFAVAAVLAMALILPLIWQPNGGDGSGLRQESPLWESTQVQAWLNVEQAPLIVRNEQQQNLTAALVHQEDGIRIYQIQPLTRPE